MRISWLFRAWVPSIQTYLPRAAFFGRLLPDAFGGDTPVPGFHSSWLAGVLVPRTLSDQRRLKVLNCVGYLR